jgi:hypothetical protein
MAGGAAPRGLLPVPTWSVLLDIMQTRSNSLPFNLPVLSFYLFLKHQV